MNQLCSLLHGQLRQPFEWNYFLLLTGRIVLSNKKRNLRKYSEVFFKHFPKKKDIWRTLYKHVSLSHNRSTTSVSVISELFHSIYSCVLLVIKSFWKFSCNSDLTVRFSWIHFSFWFIFFYQSLYELFNSIKIIYNLSCPGLHITRCEWCDLY